MDMGGEKYRKKICESYTFLSEIFLNFFPLEISGNEIIGAKCEESTFALFMHSPAKSMIMLLKVIHVISV